MFVKISVFKCKVYLKFSYAFKDTLNSVLHKTMTNHSLQFYRQGNEKTIIKQQDHSSYFSYVHLT